MNTHDTTEPEPLSAAWFELMIRVNEANVAEARRAVMAATEALHQRMGALDALRTMAQFAVTDAVTETSDAPPAV